MLDTMVERTEAKVNHTLEEMKGYGTEYQSRYPHVLRRHLNWLNSALDEINSTTDEEWKQVKINGYIRLLKVVHVNGQGGSKLS